MAVKVKVKVEDKRVGWVRDIKVGDTVVYQLVGDLLKRRKIGRVTRVSPSGRMTVATEFQSTVVFSPNGLCEGPGSGTLALQRPVTESEVKVADAVRTWAVDRDRAMRRVERALNTYPIDIADIRRAVDALETVHNAKPDHEGDVDILVTLVNNQ